MPAQAVLSPLEAMRISVLHCQTEADKAALVSGCHQVPDMTAMLAVQSPPYVPNSSQR